jgi:hypothetical protein
MSENNADLSESSGDKNNTRSKTTPLHARHSLSYRELK